MKQNFKEADFRGYKSLVMENDLLKITILPFGGRVVSIYNKNTNKEFLFQQDSNKYSIDRYAGDFVGFAPCGFDDMFPTINECFYEDYPWKGHLIPDHGEVWGLNWQYKLEENKLSLHTSGIRLPYMLKKAFYFTEKNKLRIDYSAINPTEFNMNFLWAAHPMLATETGMEFELPEDCKKAISVLNLSKRIGGFGEELDWPVNIDSNGIRHQLNKFRSTSENNCEKYYFKNKLKNGWIKIKYPADNTFLKISFPSDKVPYIGILFDEGSWKKDRLLMIPEPCTAGYDSITNSKLFSADSVLKGNSSYDWFLEFDFN